MKFSAPEQSQLFRQLADYFAAATPAVDDADMALLAEKLQSDLSEGYPAESPDRSIFLPRVLRWYSMTKRWTSS